MYMKILYRWQQWLRVYKAKRGTGTWGRITPVETKVVGTLSARVIRVDGTVEDLGVISEMKGGE